MFDKRLFTCRLDHLATTRQLTPSYERVGRALLVYVAKDATCWPSHATLAARAGVSVKTVQRGLAALSAVGLLLWAPRRARWNRRMSNLYTLLSPATVTERNLTKGVPRSKCPMGRPRSVEAQLAALGVTPAEALAGLIASRERIGRGFPAEGGRRRVE